MKFRIGWVLFLLLAITSIALGQAGTVKEIRVVGNQRINESAILGAMLTKVGAPFSQATLDADRERVDALGWFEAVDPRARLLDDGTYSVTVDVQEYPEIKEIRIVGNKGVTTDEILAAIPIKVGETFNKRRIQPAVAAITALYQRKGFFGRVEDIGPLRESPSTVNIAIIEAIINSISIQGNSKTKTRVIQRLIKSRAGEPYSEKKWFDDLRRMYSTQWFETVRPVDTESEVGRIDLLVDVKEARTGNVGLGLQVDPRSSFAGFINLSDSNFNGTGQSVGVNFLQATTGGGPSIGLSYGNPFLDDRDTFLSASVYSRLLYRFTGSTFGGGNETPTDDSRYTERRTGATLSIGRPIQERVVAAVGARIEGIRTADLDTTSGSNFIQQDGTVGILTMALTRNRRDVDVDASRGDWLRVELEPGYSNITKLGGLAQDSTILGSNIFTKATAEYRLYFSPGQAPRTAQEIDAPRRTFAFRARYGTIGGRVPFFEQYFIGGADTVRGYPEDRFWGRNSLLTTLEYRFPIQKTFNIIGFVDYGGAWGGYGSVNDFTQSDRVKLNLGYGLGLSFRTPLGPIRLDFGFNQEGGSRTHFQIGTSF